jgi:shikimate dehydrogenase
MYGLLGKTLKHSLSKTIHEEWTHSSYHLIETNDLSSIFQKKNFSGLNVTIPYKQDVISYLDELSKEASHAKAVNTIIQKNGKLIGHNTDVYGFEKMLAYHNISIKDKRIIILGNGATKRSISLVLRKLGASEIHVYARNPNDGEFALSTLKDAFPSSIIINTTPVGMFPNVSQHLDIPKNLLTNASVAIDVIYNPLRTTFLQKASDYGLKTINGLFMLISQAAKSIELFHDTKISDFQIRDMYTKLLTSQTNIVLTGMPMSGKSHYGAALAKRYNKVFVDLDSLIEQKTNMSIPNLFASVGEKGFRELEHQICQEISKEQNLVIATGGGVVLNNQNIQNLKQNGVIIFLDMPLNMLLKCTPKNRPLIKTQENIRKLYHERYSLYMKYADLVITKDTYHEATILSRFEVKLDEYFNYKRAQPKSIRKKRA